MRMVFGLAVVGALALAVPVAAQDHSGHMGHETGGVLTEPGQGAFAALSEAVALLMADETTDWSRVDIAALRAHLVDMDLLVTATDVTEEALPDGLRMTISTKGPGGAAAMRMVPAHGPVLLAETGWQSTVEVGTDAVVWTVTSEAPAVIQALGFFGLIAVGDHHPEHHLALARGEPMH